MIRPWLLCLLLGACAHTPPPAEPPSARGGGPPAPAVARDPTAQEARDVVARVRCSMLVSCGDEGDGVDACMARVRADLVGWPGCEAVNPKTLRACVAAIRDAACTWSAMPIVCAPESVCR